ncbi:MAG: zinc ABC transporter substrate-binding protein [Gammaproteobacteria bacterium]|nr:zinc ABC transporter substrate-binding protein [Gammaproteobacteria bacterium]
MHLKYFALVLVLTMGLLTSAQAREKSTPKSIPKKTVATVVPVVHSLLSQMLADTPIEITYLPPKRLPINRLANWVATHVTKKQPIISAVVGIDAMRPALSFYTALRKENIHIVAIDIAKALLPSGEQVAIYQQDQQGYFWLNLNNSLMMAGILRRDLTALWPKHTPQINKNAAKISQQLRQLAMQLDDILFELNIEQLVVAQPALADFAVSFPLPIVTLKEATANGLTTLYITKRVVKKSTLSPNVTPWIIDDFSKVSAVNYSQRWLKSSSALKR